MNKRMTIITNERNMNKEYRKLRISSQKSMMKHNEQKTECL